MNSSTLPALIFSHHNTCENIENERNGERKKERRIKTKTSQWLVS